MLNYIHYENDWSKWESKIVYFNEEQNRVLRKFSSDESGIMIYYAFNKENLMKYCHVFIIIQWFLYINFTLIQIFVCRLNKILLFNLIKFLILHDDIFFVKCLVYHDSRSVPNSSRLRTPLKQTPNWFTSTNQIYTSLIQ